MIIEGTSPTMRHVSRTHRMALDWLFDRIDLDPKIHNNVDTRSQLADILTKGNFPRDEWNHLLRLFNIMDISLFSHSHFICRVDEFSAMSKRHMQEGQEEESNRVGAKSRLARNLVALVLAMSPSQSNSDPIPESAGTPEAYCQSSRVQSTGRPDAVALSTKDAHRSQERKRTNKHGKTSCAKYSTWWHRKRFATQFFSNRR